MERGKEANKDASQARDCADRNMEGRFALNATQSTLFGALRLLRAD
jgi:hypothetical protein